MTNEPQAKIIREIYNMRADGMSLNGIANVLNSKKHRDKNKEAYLGKENKTWANQSVNWILHNDYYIGMITFAGEKINGNHAPIIDIELWDAVRVIDARRRK